MTEPTRWDGIEMHDWGPRLWAPEFRLRPPLDLNGLFPPSSWAGIDWALPALLHRWVPRCEVAVEFGVEFGFSTAALGCYFQRVVGVDPFMQSTDFAEATWARLAPYKNVTLRRQGWRSWADAHEFERPDLIHIDIDPHDYDMTYAAGTWAARHSDCVLFHDTENPLADVKRAVGDIAGEQGMEFWNWLECNGLGILVKGDK
jgi:hypothetical protein